MAIGFVAAVGAGNDFASSITAALSVGSNSNRAVFVYAFKDRTNATTINGVTYAGVSLTDSAVTIGNGRLFYGAVSATGSNNIVATFSDNGMKPNLVALAYDGVHQTTLLENLASANNFNTNMDRAVTSATGDVAAFLAWASAGGVDPGFSGGTGTSVRNNAIARSPFWVLAGDEPGAASVTVGGTFPGNREWYGFWFSVKAAAAAGGVINPARMTGGMVEMLGGMRG